MRRPLLVVAIALLTAAVLGQPLYSSYRSSRAAARPLLESPDNWVPFSADVETISPGYETTTGRYFRNHHGSQRFEAVRPSDGATIIEILNVSSSTYYVNSRGRGWISQPMDVGEADWRPKKLHADMPRLERYGLKLDIEQGGTGNVKAKKGLDAYMYTTGTGGVRLIVPALNFFPVVMQQMAGHSKRFFNISIGEPPVELFDPPPSAVVNSSSVPFKLNKSGVAPPPLEDERQPKDPAQ